MPFICGLLALCFVLVFGVAVVAVGLGLVPTVVGVGVSLVCVVGVWGATARIP